MMSIFMIEVFRRDWRQILYWGAGLAVLGFMITAVIPDVEALNRYGDMLEALPPVILNAFGADDVSAVTTPEGFIAFSYFSYAMLVLVAFSVLAGLSITANEEEAGILDIVLSLPVARWVLMFGRFAAYAIMAVAIILIGLLSLLIGISTTPIAVDGGRLVLSAVNMIPSVLLLIAFTMFASALFRRRSVAVGVVAAFVSVSYFIDFIANAVTHVVIQTLSWLSFFTYYNSQAVIADGLSLSNILVLLVAAGGFIACALWFFQRRDVGV